MKKETITQIEKYIEDNNLSLVESDQFNYRYRIVKHSLGSHTQFFLNVIPKAVSLWKPETTISDIHITKIYASDEALDVIKRDIEILRCLDEFSEDVEKIIDGESNKEEFRHNILQRLPIDTSSTNDNIFGLYNHVAWAIRPCVNRLIIQSYGKCVMRINKSYGILNYNSAENAINIINKASFIYNLLL